MPERSSKFIYGFFILFLSILLLMFLMFTIMVHYNRGVGAEEKSSTVSGEERDVSEVTGGGVHDLTALYRANLFAIDLCLIVLAEAALIVVFVKFTLPAVLVATIGLIFMAADTAQSLRGELIPKFVSPFVANRYATLTHSDLMLLIVLSGLVMAFLVSVLLQHAGVKMGGETSRESDSSPPSPPAPQ